MLTTELARFEIQGNEVKPRYISRKEAALYLPICEQIISLYHASIGKKRNDIDSALSEIERRADFKVVRGLAKLVDDECVFAPAESIDYEMLRTNVFRAAQSRYPLVTKTDLLHTTHRDDAVKTIAAELGYSAEQLESLLVADLPQYHVLNAATKLFTPESLLQRYNLALAQALLYRTTEMTITLKSDYQIVWKYMKLARLIHEIDKLDEGYRIRLTGPASVFRNTQRYGIRMALFLPGLLLAKEFTMEAVINIHDQERFFRLDEQCGLRSYYAETSGEFDSSLEETFYESFRSRENTGWSIKREADLIDLGDTVVIPDFTFMHEDGRKAMLEIVGFWTPEYIEKKLNKLSRVRDTNLIIALSNSLNCARVDVANLQGKKLLFFKGVLKVKDVVECLGSRWPCKMTVTSRRILG